MKLYYAPGACSLSPHIVLRELAREVTLVKVDLKTRKTESGDDFTQINPKGYVPALQLDDGAVLTEGPAIVQYLADQQPKAGLAPPAGTLERARVQEWLNYITAELHKQFSPLFRPTTPAETREAQMQTLQNRIGFVDRALAGKKFLMGDAFTVADAYAFVVLTWSKAVKLDLSAHRNVVEYMKRVGERPAVTHAMQEEGLLPKTA